MNKKTSKSTAQRWTSVLFTAIALLMASSLVAYAQNDSIPPCGGEGCTSFSITVRSCAGVGLPGVTVVLYGENNGNTITKVTGPSGTVLTGLIPIDVYTVTPTPTTGFFFNPPSVQAGGGSVNFTRYRRDNRANFDGDCKTDLSVYDAGIWRSLNSSNNQYVTYQFGLSDDVITPGDYNADGKTDYAVFRRSDGNWYVDTDISTPLAFDVTHFGISRDTPVARDYDGDAKTDIAVFRSSSSTWYILNSSDNSVTIIPWGQAGDRVVPGDYDGDNKADIAVFRPSDGIWYIRRSSDGGLTAIQWGLSEDLPVQADYDGDGKTDIAVYRPSTQQWFILNSSDGSLHSEVWGLASDIKVPGDYDGDGKADVAVQRPGTGIWYIIYSSGGSNGDGFPFFGGFPVPAGYLTPF